MTTGKRKPWYQVVEPREDRPMDATQFAVHLDHRRQMREVVGKCRISPSAQFDQQLFAAFPLAWSHYVRLMAIEKPRAHTIRRIPAGSFAYTLFFLDKAYQWTPTDRDR